MTIEQYARKNEGRLVELLCRLIAANTENPPGNEHLAAAIMRDELEPLGIPCTAYEKEPGRTNLVARIGSGPPRILIACHFDVVPAGDGWETDPYTAVVRNGRVYGRGADDNKGQLAAMIEAAKYLKQNESRLTGEVILAGVADEERGSNLGLEWLADEGILDADFAIIPDISHEMEAISIGEKGALFVKVVSQGRQAHGSRPRMGVNAIANMIDFLNEVRKLDFNTGTGSNTNVKTGVNTGTDTDADSLFSPPTCNIGVISGGSAANIVPARCEAQIDFRFLPSQSSAQIERTLHDIAGRIERASQGAKFTFETMMHVDPFLIDTDNLLLARLRKTAQDVLGKEPEFIGLSGSTVAKPLVRTGTVAVGFGPGEDTQAHIANESVRIESLLKFVEILARFLLEEEQ